MQHLGNLTIIGDAVIVGDEVHNLSFLSSRQIRPAVEQEILHRDPANEDWDSLVGHEDWRVRMCVASNLMHLEQLSNDSNEQVRNFSLLHLNLRVPA